MPREDQGEAEGTLRGGRGEAGRGGANVVSEIIQIYEMLVCINLYAFTRF